MCLTLHNKAPAPEPLPPPTPPSRTILILGSPTSNLTAFYNHVHNSQQYLNLNGISHRLALFDGTPLHAYQSSLRKDHLQCFTGAIILYSPSDSQSLEAAKGIIDELRKHEFPCLPQGSIILVANSENEAESEGEIGMIEGVDAYLECDVESGERCEEVVGRLVGVIEGRWEEWWLEREKRIAREEWEARMKKRRGRFWRRVLCKGT